MKHARPGAYLARADCCGMCFIQIRGEQRDMIGQGMESFAEQHVCRRIRRLLPVASSGSSSGADDGAALLGVNGMDQTAVSPVREAVL